MLGDHLGSTSTIVDQAGVVQSQQYYFPYGDNRGGSQSSLTAKRFTGQYHEAGIGLYYYNARWYDSRLGRFAQADTIVPNPASPQSLNRYMYVVGNPLKYRDPSGHYIFEDNPNDPYVWERDKPADVLVRTAEPVVNWEETQEADILLPAKIIFGGAAVAVAGEAMLIDFAVPAAQAGWVKFAEALGIACADGDCGNEVENLTQELPDEIASTFKNSQYQARVLTKPLTVYRAEGSTFGRWFGAVKPDSAANAERLYNIVKYENDALQVSTYEILPGATIYEGPVAGGTGWQIFIENPLSGFIQLIETEFLPQWGF